MDSIASLLNNVGKNIAKLRKANKLTQQTMANNVGVSISQYRRIENSTANASISTLIKIAAYLDTGIDLLVYGEEVKKQNEFIQLQEQDLIEKMKELEGLNSTDKKLAHQLLDLVIAKKKLDELVDKIHQPK